MYRKGTLTSVNGMDGMDGGIGICNNLLVVFDLESCVSSKKSSNL